MKPFQATASLELAGHPPLTPDEVAVGWASHRAEAPHLEAVRALCRRAGMDVADLTTPPEGGSRLHHNCSGKHALFALAGREVGVSGRALLDPDGPVQRHALATIRDALGTDIVVSVDGCGAPAAAGPLQALARAYRRLADGEERWAPVVDAGLARPHLVGGTGQLESVLLARGVVAKPGAEGVFAVGWSTDEGPWGLAVKVEDGAGRAASAAVAAILVARGVDPGWEPPPVLGGGEPAGGVRGCRPAELRD